MGVQRAFHRFFKSTQTWGCFLITNKQVALRRMFKLKNHNGFVLSQVGKVWSKTIKQTKTQALADVTPRENKQVILPEILLLKSKDPFFFFFFKSLVTG